jgi:hypothetical protein
MVSLDAAIPPSTVQAKREWLLVKPGVDVVADLCKVESGLFCRLCFAHELPGVEASDASLSPIFIGVSPSGLRTRHRPPAECELPKITAPPARRWRSRVPGF